MKTLKYVINTVPNYKKASDILEQSLIEDGIKKEDIIYIYGKHNEFKIEKNNLNQVCVYIKTNFYEYNSILALFKLFSQDKNYLNYNYLLLHDTCKALKGFKEKSIKLNERLNNSNGDIFWAHKQGRHNIGIFSPRSIMVLIKNSIIPLFEKNFDKTYALKMEWDLVPEALHVQTELKHIYSNEHTLSPVYNSKLYSKNKPRNITYFMCLNLVKYFIQLGPIRENIGKLHPDSLE